MLPQDGDGIDAELLHTKSWPVPVHHVIAQQPQSLPLPHPQSPTQPEVHLQLRPYSQLQPQSQPHVQWQTQQRLHDLLMQQQQQLLIQQELQRQQLLLVQQRICEQQQQQQQDMQQQQQQASHIQQQVAPGSSHSLSAASSHSLSAALHNAHQGQQMQHAQHDYLPQHLQSEHWRSVDGSSSELQNYMQAQSHLNYPHMQLHGSNQVSEGMTDSPHQSASLGSHLPAAATSAATLGSVAATHTSLPVTPQEPLPGTSDVLREVLQAAPPALQAVVVYEEGPLGWEARDPPPPWSTAIHMLQARPATTPCTACGTPPADFPPAPWRRRISPTCCPTGCISVSAARVPE